MKEKRNIEIVRTKRKSLSLEISDTAQIIVRAPMRLSEKTISDFLNKNDRWIEKKYTDSLRRLAFTLPHSFVEGDVLPYIGVSYPIVETSKNTVDFTGSFFIPTKEKELRRQLLIEWYKKKALEVFRERVRELALEMNVKPQRIRISNAKKRWGSCNTKGTVRISWRLILAPRDIIDYVIIHELSHLTHMNHSKRFWSKVKKHYMEHTYAEKWLQKYSTFLSL